MKRNNAIIALLLSLLLLFTGCTNNTPVADSSVSQQTDIIETQTETPATEQSNVTDEAENKNSDKQPETTQQTVNFDLSSIPEYNGRAYVAVNNNIPCMLNSDVGGMKKAIKAREIMLKGANRAKTAHPGEFNNDEWYGGKELDYRFYNAKTIIRDIFESEGLIDVKSK